jgi:hypothetical protein
MMKINFIAPINYFKNLLKRLIFFKNFYNNKIKLPNLLKKITKLYTKTINNYFIIIIIAACLITIVISYYEQHYKFKKQLFDKNAFVNLRIDKTIQNFKKSLSIFSEIMTSEQRYLDPIKTSRILKIAYTTDPNLSLISLTWHTWLEPKKSISAFGSIIGTPDNPFFNMHNDKLKQPIIYDQIDNLNILNLVIIYPAIDKNTPDAEGTPIGYFKMSAEVPTLIKTLYDKLDEEDLIRISRNDDFIYFGKGENRFKVINNPTLTKYQFADNDSSNEYPSQISLGQDDQQIIVDILQTIGLRCGIILALGGAMLLTFNYIERQKAKRLYDENSIFVEKISSLEKHVDVLKAELDIYTKENNDIKNLNHSYQSANSIINSINQKIRQDVIASVVKIQEISFLKHHKMEKEVTPEMIENTLTSILKISDDLIHNIVSRNDILEEINLSDLFDELLDLFSPVIISNSIQIQKNIDNINVTVNELAIKQVLISLLFKSLCSISRDGNVKISTHQDESRNIVNIEISSDGYSVSDQLIKSILDHNKKSLLPCIVNVQLESASLEIITREILLGKLITIKQNNQIILSFPIERKIYEKSDKIIPFHK